MVFVDRIEAGRKLAAKLRHYANRSDVIVLGLPRGGVPVACEVARKLNTPLDVFVVRKVGVPGRVELAMGAVASGGVQVVNEDVLEELNIPKELLERAVSTEIIEVQRREKAYRRGKPPINVTGQIVLLVDDGLATGATMRAAVLALRRLGPARIVVAVPVGARETCDIFRSLADEVVCVEQPDPFFAVGNWYRDFSQTSDEEVCDLLRKANQLPLQAAG